MARAPLRAWRRSKPRTRVEEHIAVRAGAGDPDLKRADGGFRAVGDGLREKGMAALGEGNRVGYASIATAYTQDTCE